MTSLRKIGVHRALASLLVLTVAALCGCSDDPAADPHTTDSAGDSSVPDATSDSSSGDVPNPQWAPDETDKAVIALLDKIHDGLANKALWPQFALPDKPLYLVRRSLKGTAQYGLLTHVAKAPTDSDGMPAKAHKVGGHVVYRYDGKLDALSSTRLAYSYEDVAGVQATLAAYDVATPDDPVAFIGALGKASFERMKELDDPWKPVEGCGLSKYPRKKELIELTLLEDALLAEALTAKPADLPARMTEIVAVRARRLEVEPYTDRIDADGENRWGAPHFARVMLPVLVGVQAEKKAHDALKKSLNDGMTVPIADLDDQLMWRRPLPAAVVLIGLARRLNIPVATSFKDGKAAVAAIIAAKGQPDLSHIAAARKRHDMAAIEKRAAALMAY